jgi:hypothetical protein
VSNIITLRHLIHCVAAALAVSAALTVISLPRPETAAAGATDQDAKAACLRTWPYYERSCLRDSRRDGDVQAVRVIGVDGQVGYRVPRR